MDEGSGNTKQRNALDAKDATHASADCGHVLGTDPRYAYRRLFHQRLAGRSDARADVWRAIHVCLQLSYDVAEAQRDRTTGDVAEHPANTAAYQEAEEESSKEVKTLGPYVGIAGAAMLALVVLSFTAGRGCRGTVAPMEDLRVDTSVQDTAADRKRLAAGAEARAKIQQLETTHAANLEQFSMGQAREYERIRETGPVATARWLADFDKQL